MKIRMVACCVLLMGVLGMPLMVSAHHGTQAYDQRKQVTLKGVITNFEWSNPHTQIHLDATDEKGVVAHWNFEAQPPNILVHAGWTRDSLKPGDQVTIVGNPAKNGATVGIIQKVILANGQELTMVEK